MTSVKSATNGNVFEVEDEALVAKLVAEGHAVVEAVSPKSKKTK